MKKKGKYRGAVDLPAKVSLAHRYELTRRGRGRRRRRGVT